jgi:FkbM family methyltransferase
VTFRRFLIATSSLVPVRLKLLVLGERENPSPLASSIHALLNRLPGERYPILTCEGPLEGFCMRLDWRKFRGFVYGTYEPDVVATLQRIVCPGMTVFDIGAHAGFFTLLLSRLTGPGGSVIAFEPLPANSRILEENLSLNGCQNARSIRSAVSNASGTFQLDVPDANSWLLAGPSQPGESGPRIEVPAISIDDFVKQSAIIPTLLKIDIEGAELSVLHGAAITLAQSHPTLLVELHHPDITSAIHPAVPLLENLGYRISWLGGSGFTGHILAEWGEATASSRASK